MTGTQPTDGWGRRQAYPVHDWGHVCRAQGRLQGLSGRGQGAGFGWGGGAVHAYVECWGRVGCWEWS